MLFLLLYVIVGILNLIAEYSGLQSINYGTKVLLMPLLAIFLWRKAGFTRQNRLIFFALFFSWLGDILLMFPRNEYSQSAKEQLFIAGLTAFLLAHLNYIASFVKDIYNVPKVSVIVEKPYLIWPFALYLFFILRFLGPHLGEMKFPVILYGICITMMLVTAFNRKNIISNTSFYLVLTGAILFLISDSCISINVFYKRFSWDRFVIMSTYIAAQGLIVMGVTKTQLAAGVPSRENS